MLIVFDIDTSDKERAAREICLAFEAVMPRAQREAKLLPPLYQSGVKYIRQDPRACAFRTPAEVFKRGGGDCKQLVLWRIAEQRNSGIWAMPRIIWLRENDEFVAHAQDRVPKAGDTDKYNPTGDIEDPSVDLGMAKL